MTSRLRAAVAALYVVFALALVVVDATTATPAAARPDCIRPCRF